MFCNSDFFVRITNFKKLLFLVCICACIKLYVLVTFVSICACNKNISKYKL